jgi:hypothetical protein
MSGFTFGFTDDFDYLWHFPADDPYSCSFSLGPNGPDPESLTHKRSESDPSVHVVRTDGDAEFNGLCENPLVTFDPCDLGFVPSGHWRERKVPFGSLVTGHFQKKSGTYTRFFYKLYNALKISEFDPFYTEYVGIEWLTDRIIKIDKKKFARLLGLRAIEGSLFHRQGNFPSHGFREIGPLEARTLLSAEVLANVDHDSVRLLVHTPGDFVKGSSEKVFEKCRWINRRANRLNSPLCFSRSVR